jgi:hypothetical protein
VVPTSSAVDPGAMMRYALWLLVLSVLALCGLAYLLRKRRKRRDDPRYHIPPFLRGDAMPGDDAVRTVATDWTEIHPAPGRHRQR